MKALREIAEGAYCALWLAGAVLVWMYTTRHEGKVDDHKHQR